MRDTYQRLYELDDGLLPIEKTRLLSPRALDTTISSQRHAAELTAAITPSGTG